MIRLRNLKVVFAALISCLMFFSSTLQFNQVNASIEIGVENKASNKSLDNEYENKTIEFISTVVEVINESELVSDLIKDLQNLSGDIQVSDVQVFSATSNVANGTRIFNGSTVQGITVKVFYDNGESWIEHCKAPQINVNNSVASTVSFVSTLSNSYGFVLPLDAMNLTSHITCLFSCSNIKGCSKCMADGWGTWRTSQHNGIDISWGGIDGTSVRAVRAGTATTGFSSTGWGNWVKVVHNNGLSTLYAHLKDGSAVSGQVSQGAIIGKVGNTGNSSGSHLHFEVYNSSNVRVDPLPYLQGAPVYKPITYTITLNKNGGSGGTGNFIVEHGNQIPASITPPTRSGYTFNGYYREATGTQYYNSSGTRLYTGNITGGSRTLVAKWTVTTNKTFKIVDGPLNIRASANTTSTSYGTLQNGTTLSISTIQTGNNNYVFGKIASGTYNGRWIAIGRTNGDIYAADLTSTWRVIDGPLNVRQTASTSATSYGLITNGSTFKITDTVKSGSYIFGKISSSSNPVLASGSTCTVANAKGRWVALSYGTERYCTT